MASVYPMALTQILHRIPEASPLLRRPTGRSTLPSRFLSGRRRLVELAAAGSSSARASMAERLGMGEGEAMGVDTLHHFVRLNLGNWNGSFYQFDVGGNLLQNVSTRLAASSFGEDELISLSQTLYIKQAPSRTSISGYEDEPEWVEYKIKETNMFTVDKYQQIGYFPDQKAFSLRYQTAGMMESVLRAGVLGEDDIGEESPRNLRLPSRRPSLVCENCLHSLEKNTRARAFHVMDPKGILEMLLIFLEQTEEGIPFISSTDGSEDDTDRLTPLLGRWEGRSITKRSGVYGATISEAETVSCLEIDDNGQIIQDISSKASGSSTIINVHWTGKASSNLVSFDGGFQMTLLPGGMYMGCPSDVGRSVAQSQSFHLEFCWMEAPCKRQRLVRTYDVEGQMGSSFYFGESMQTLNEVIYLPD